MKGKVLDAAGYGIDRQFGHVAVTYLTTVAPSTTGTIKVLIKRVTEYTSVGSLYGTASALENLTTGAITNGKIDLRHGTGELKGYEFAGTFSGSYDFKTSRYTFHYAGKLR